MLPVIVQKRALKGSASMVQKRNKGAAPVSCPLPDQKLWKAHHELDMLMLDG
jgi:hypothetical protein